MCLIRLLGIAFTLFALASKFIVTQRRTREGLSKPLAFSLPLLFIFATLVGCHFFLIGVTLIHLYQHLGGTWARTFKGFVNENGKSDVFWTIVTSAEQSVTQVGQVGAIVLGDGMIVRLLPPLDDSRRLTMLQVYRTHMVWSKGLTVIIAPCIALLATIGEFDEICPRTPTYLIRSCWRRRANITPHAVRNRQ
jgi:hypothetical protein